ncbi:MAG: CCA tRNA nucleotidyltransferase, partial [Bacilli bacterium]
MDQNAYFEKGLAIVRRLNECTYEAYLVGGIVRDHLMHMPFTDIDIATNATPEQILEVFPDASTEYMTMGTMSVRLDGFKFEIATFRSEVYTVSRKPTEIHYSQKLQDDIMRRDFTINGMAMSASQNIIDFCGGRKDLQKGIIRTIGKPKKSFREDPLRILRAFSLMARFNFKLAKATQKSIKQTKKYL